MSALLHEARGAIWQLYCSVHDWQMKQEALGNHEDGVRQLHL